MTNLWLCDKYLFFHLLCIVYVQVEEEASVQERVSEKLWELAETKLHISETRTIFPHVS